MPKLTYLIDDTNGVPSDKASLYWIGARLEPRCRSEKAVQSGLEARVADPLWMLARQWQMGEFIGEDNGSPVQVEVEYETEILDSVRPWSDTASESAAETSVAVPRPFSGSNEAESGPPLETVVERERFPLDCRTRVQIGQQFERFLHRAFASDTGAASSIISLYRQPVPYFGIASPEPLETIDYATQRFIRLMQGRAVDGAEVLNAYAERRLPELPEDLQVHNEKLNEALDALAEWYAALYNQPLSSEAAYWKPRELEYEFVLAGKKPSTGAPAPSAEEETTGQPVDTDTPGGSATAGGIPPISTGRQPFAIGTGHTFPMGLEPQDRQRTELVATDYRNGDLDWYSCDAASRGKNTFCNPFKGYTTPVAVEPQARPTPTYPTLTLHPTRVAFAGKPNERWWAFEDANVDLARVDTVTPNLAKLLTLQFALVHADDWYLVPLELPLGSITRIRSLTVEDVFGIGGQTRIEPAIETGATERDSWQLFTLSDADRASSSAPTSCLFLPPTLGWRENSPAIEEIRFVRDEGANMVFAIENRLQNGLGDVVDGTSAHVERLDRCRRKLLEDSRRELVALEDRLADASLTEDERQTLNERVEALRGQISALLENPTPSPHVEGLPAYRLASPVPDHWIPYIPMKVPESFRSGRGVNEHSIRLRQAEMVRSDDANGVSSNQPMTRVLTENGMHWLNEESVPRAGAKLQLTRQRVRWTDGKTYVWFGRKVLTGRGEGEAGLVYDRLVSRGR